MPRTRSETGRQAEDLACRYLAGHGLKTLCRNFHSPRGELDVIMEDGDTIVFVEVRYRRHDRYGSAAETVNHSKQGKLIATALYYLQQHPNYSNRPTRFDVVAISPQTRQDGIDWIKDAFQT